MIHNITLFCSFCFFFIFFILNAFLTFSVVVDVDVYLDPPFEQAHVSDRWFKPLASGNFRKFWKNHRGCSIANDENAKNLLEQLFTFDPKERISIADIKKHAWFNDKFLQLRQK